MFPFFYGGKRENYKRRKVNYLHSPLGGAKFSQSGEVRQQIIQKIN